MRNSKIGIIINEYTLKNLTNKVRKINLQNIYKNLMELIVEKEFL